MKPTLKLVHRLDETVSTMSSMLDKLLDINQLEAGIVRPAIVDFPIKGLLDELRTEFTYHTATNGLDWRVVPSSLTVRSDPRLLEQIIRNLLSNAVKYTTEGKLLLGCRRRGDKLRIEVWDTGPGIPELELQAIFEEFHQLDNPARERSKGLGLGLAIVQRLADLLGHKIDVRSRLGAGSVFTIEVPLGRPEAADLPVPSQNETQVSTPSRGTILIVEDDPAVLEMLQLLFDDEGHRTVVAADGHKALELAAQGSTVPDLVIADYNLPKGLNGLEIIARLQKQAQHAIPAIILTGDISTDSLREIAGHGCVHLNKPVRAKELTRLAQRLLAKPRSAAPDSVQQLPLCLDGEQVVHRIRRRRRPRHPRGDARSASGERVCGGAFRRWPGLPRSLSSRPRRMPSGRCADARHERCRADRAPQSRRPPTAGHRDHREWRRADGRSSDEGGSRGFHREAGRPRRAARQRQARARSDAGHRHAVCIAGDGCD